MFSLKELYLALDIKLPEKFKNLRVLGISTDTRTLRPGELFIPLAGDHFDGHVFIGKALRSGAIAALSSRKINIAKKHIIKVPDTLNALQKIAAYHRGKFNVPIIAITGSCGKTTTKDMLASILSQKFKALKNEGNLNNEIGVPLTLLRLNKSHQAAIIEMGMQKKGDIAELAQIARPSIAIITNIGEAHLEFMKNKRNIALGKSEILRGLKPGSCAILNADDAYFKLLKKLIPVKVKLITFGIGLKADVSLKDLRKINIPVPGKHNAYNALAAAAAAKILDIRKNLIKKGLEGFMPSDKRMRITKAKNNITIINDAYNANPTSMAAALKTLADMPGRKLAVLGDMLELGRASKKLHQKIGRLAKKLGINKLITVGARSVAMDGGIKFKNNPSASKHIRKILKPGDIVLIKGSRGMKMEEIAEALLR